MKIRKNYRSLFLILDILATCFLYGCKGDDSELDGNTFSEIAIRIIDKDGNDVVEKWYLTSPEMKMTEGENMSYTKYPSKSINPLHAVRQADHGFVFCYSYVLDTIEVGDSVSWRFKLYEEDNEDILFEGLCMEDIGKPVTPFNVCLNRNIQWSFRESKLPLETSLSVTLVRSEDGCYTLKNNN